MNRILKFATNLLYLVLIIYLSFQIIIYYFQFNSNVRIAVENAESTSMPAVSVCAPIQYVQDETRSNKSDDASDYFKNQIENLKRQKNEIVNITEQCK